SSKKRSRSCSSAPQAGGALPIIGHIHHFGGQQLIHKTLGAMADKYGLVFSIRLGSHQVLVLNSWEWPKNVSLSMIKFSPLDQTLLLQRF
ncbi:hypothetical protein Golax_025476, partial [Gossypium laxum]|nr:hypothetical protein [Gossypium laxum]